MDESPRSKMLDVHHTNKHRLTLAEWHNGYGKCIEVGVRSLNKSDDFSMLYLPSWSPEKWFELVKTAMYKYENVERVQKIINWFEEHSKQFHRWYEKQASKARGDSNEQR